MLNTLHSDILRVLLNVLFCKSEPYYLERVSGSWREIVKKISLLSSHNPSIYVEITVCYPLHQKRLIQNRKSACFQRNCKLIDDLVSV